MGDEFIEFLLENLFKRHNKTISKDELRRSFTAVDQSPYWMMKVISHLITFEETLTASLNYVLQLIEAAEGFEQIAKKLRPIDKIVFLALSSGHTPFSKELLQKIDRETDVKGVYPNVQRSLKRLIEQHLVTQISKGGYSIEKPGFKEYLIRHNH